MFDTDCLSKYSMVSNYPFSINICTSNIRNLTEGNMNHNNLTVTFISHGLRTRDIHFLIINYAENNTIFIQIEIEFQLIREWKV